MFEPELGSCPRTARAQSCGWGGLPTETHVDGEGTDPEGEPGTQAPPLGRWRRQPWDLSGVDEAEPARLTQEPVEFSSSGSRQMLSLRRRKQPTDAQAPSHPADAPAAGPAPGFSVGREM